MIMKKGTLIVILICGFLVLTGLISMINMQDNPLNVRVTQTPQAVDTYATDESVSSLVDSLNDFSLDFYKEIIKENSGNIFFSPYSIYTALSMAYEGADGNTAEEMYNILKIEQADQITECSFGRVYNLLNKKQDGYEISTANAFWAHKDYTFLESYLSLLKDYYMAEAYELDFAKNVESADTINNWIEEKTHDKIKDMIQSSSLSDLTKLVLTNAIYFKGLWAKQFDSDNTYKTDFELSNTQKTDVDMMVYSGDDSNFNYTEIDDAGLKVLQLDYDGMDLSMFIILPIDNNITIAESQLNKENLIDWKSNLYETEVNVEIPKFKFETEYNLNQVLQNLGIEDAFNSGVADFSKMDGTRNLYISEALHKAYIEVNEEGTEAAAATSIVMSLSMVPNQFKADHPFLFLIEHKETGAILFIGRVMNPSE